MPINIACSRCGRVVQAPPSRAKTKKFCSRSCLMESLAELARKRTGKLHQNYVGRVTVECGTCSAAMVIRPAAKRKTNYCSVACNNKAIAEAGAKRNGNKHPLWLGGSDEYRGPNWQRQRKLALTRDENKCTVCSAPTKTVHHLRPFRLFTNYKEANDLDNLSSLCRSCHRLADAAFWDNNRDMVLPLCRSYAVVACKKCGNMFDGHDGALSANGILRYCQTCRLVKICLHCKKAYDLTSRRYSPERNAASKFCSAACSGAAKRGKPPPCVIAHKYRRQLGDSAV